MVVRPSRSATLLCCGLLTASLVAGCSKSGSDQSASSSPAPSTSSATATRAPAPTDALPAELRPVIEKLYSGGTVPATSGAAAALKARVPSAIPAGTKVAGSVGGWKGTPIAAVSVKNDVTLLVKDKKAGWQVVGGWWPGLKAAAPQLGGKRFVAVLGVDARPGEKPEETRADSIHVLGYDGKDGGGLLGMARDTWVTLPSGHRSKINAAMVEGGPQGMTAALARQIGVPVQSYAYTDFVSFTKMVDAVGGIDVTVPEGFSGGGHSFTTGKNHLTGVKALAFARERKSLAGGDFTRSEHQGLLLLAGGLAAKAKGPAGLPPLVTKISPYIQSNLTAEQAITLFAMPYALDLAKVGNKVSAGGFGTSSDGQSIVLAGGAEQALYADFADGNLTP